MWLVLIKEWFDGQNFGFEESEFIIEVEFRSLHIMKGGLQGLPSQAEEVYSHCHSQYDYERGSELISHRVLSMEVGEHHICIKVEHVHEFVE